MKALYTLQFKEMPGDRRLFMEHQNRCWSEKSRDRFPDRRVGGGRYHGREGDKDDILQPQSQHPGGVPDE